MLKPKRSVEERFWVRILISSSNHCWIRQAPRIRNGYTLFWRDGKYVGAHRVAFELWWGVTLPSWLQVCHDCPEGDNKACCNPDHLFVSDAKGHAADKISKGQILRGDQSPARKNPDRMSRGDRHWSRLRPEKRAYGNRNGAHTHPERVLRGEQAGSSKLRATQVREIRRRRQNGETLQSLAKEFGVHHATISRIDQGKTWKHLFERENEHASGSIQADRP